MPKIAIDIDGVLCDWVPGDYAKATPRKENIEKIQKLLQKYPASYFYTARGSSLGSVSAAEEKWGELTRSQLESWGLGGVEVVFGKPMYDLLIDDKAVNGIELDVDQAESIVERSIAIEKLANSPSS